MKPPVEPHLFSPLTLRGLTLRNRIAVSPMCQYSSVDGFADDWHLVHLGSRAVGGAALVFTEAAGVSAVGRISPRDLGIYHDRHVATLARCVRYIKARGSAAGIQLAHAGRKASTKPPWEGGAPLTVAEGAWPVLGPSPVPFAEGHPVPVELDEAGIHTIIDEFRQATRRALAAGFDVIELHAAHGYLLHSFLSPFSNRRADRYGGSLENRCRIVVELAAAVRGIIPDAMPLFVRISATDWADGGWDVAQSVELARLLAKEGVDLIDCSSGGNLPKVRIPIGPGYQVPFAEQVRRDASIKTGAVGLITEPAQADDIIQSGKADLVLLARAMLRDPYWPMHAANALGREIDWPVQYGRARN